MNKFLQVLLSVFKQFPSAVTSPKIESAVTSPKIESAVTSPKIIPGQIYRFNPKTSDPFPQNSYHLVEVLDIKDGWVQYKFLPNMGLFQDLRQKAWLFLHMYKLEGTM